MLLNQFLSPLQTYFFAHLCVPKYSETTTNLLGNKQIVAFNNS